MVNTLESQQKSNQQLFHAGKLFRYEGSDSVMRLDRTSYGYEYISVDYQGAWIFGGSVIKYSKHGVILDLFDDLIACEFSKMVFL